MELKRLFQFFCRRFLSRICRRKPDKKRRITLYDLLDLVVWYIRLSRLKRTIWRKQKYFFNSCQCILLFQKFDTWRLHQMIVHLIASLFKALFIFTDWWEKRRTNMCVYYHFCHFLLFFAFIFRFYLTHFFYISRFLFLLLHFVAFYFFCFNLFSSILKLFKFYASYLYYSNTSLWTSCNVLCNIYGSFHSEQVFSLSEENL